MASISSGTCGFRQLWISAASDGIPWILLSLGSLQMMMLVLVARYSVVAPGLLRWRCIESLNTSYMNLSHLFVEARIPESERAGDARDEDRTEHHVVKRRIPDPWFPLPKCLLSILPSRASHVDGCSTVTGGYTPDILILCSLSDCSLR